MQEGRGVLRACIMFDLAEVYLQVVEVDGFGMSLAPGDTHQLLWGYLQGRIKQYLKCLGEPDR